MERDNKDDVTDRVERASLHVDWQTRDQVGYKFNQLASADLLLCLKECCPTFGIVRVQFQETKYSSFFLSVGCPVTERRQDGNNNSQKETK